LFFDFSSPLADPVGSVLLTCPGPLSVLLSDLGWTMSRRTSEELKEDGEPKMTPCDGLRISGKSTLNRIATHLGCRKPNVHYI
jgi:hypothetical protein